MLHLFGSLSGFLRAQSCTTDNLIYRMHYRASSILLLGLSLVVTAGQYFGDPIDCIANSRAFSQNLLDTYCWIHTTYSIEGSWNKSVGQEVPYPGVDKTTPDERRVYHTYYQWVCFVLFAQSIFFYLPRYLWKSVEGGLVKNLVQCLDRPIVPKEDRFRSIDLTSEYLARNMRLHNSLFLLFAFTEVFNLLNVLVQIWLMDRFLGGQFLDYGLSVVQISGWGVSLRQDQMLRVFPRLTKCTFHWYGPSGDVQRHDAMCLLPLNLVNEKVYLFLWLWFYFLALASLCSLFYRALTILSDRIRILAIKSHCRMAPSNSIHLVLSFGTIGDWFVLDLLSKNIDSLHFINVLNHLEEKLVTCQKPMRLMRSSS